MRVITQYQCEVCSTIYSHKESCQYCEESPPLPPCQYEVGQRVSFQTRYNGIQQAVIKALSIECIYDQEYNVIEAWGKDTLGMIARFEKTKTDRQTHCYVLTLNEEFQFGKGFWSNQISEDCVIK